MPHGHVCSDPPFHSRRTQGWSLPASLPQALATSWGLVQLRTLCTDLESQEVQKPLKGTGWRD